MGTARAWIVAAIASAACVTAAAAEPSLLEFRHDLAFRRAAVDAFARRAYADADRIGFFLGARAGFDPPAMLSLLDKLGADEPGDSLSTHPTRRLRIDQASAMLQAAEVVRGWATQAPRAGRRSVSR